MADKTLGVMELTSVIIHHVDGIKFDGDLWVNLKAFKVNLMAFYPVENSHTGKVNKSNFATPRYGDEDSLIGN